MSSRSKGIEWPRIAVVIFSVGLLVGIIGYSLWKKPLPLESLPIQARIELAAGEVLVDQGKGEKPVSSASALLAGARVRTGEGARALVRLPDGASAFLRGGTLLVLGEERVELETGEYWLDAPAAERKPLSHRAGAVEVSAADAGLSIRREGAEVAVFVARGMAVVASTAGRVEVSAGQLASVSGEQAPALEAVSFWEDWTGGMADFGTAALSVATGQGEIFAIDAAGPSGSAAERLQIKSQAVRAVVRDGLAETEVDQTFFNPASRAVEGWYWFTVPEGASVTSFALETNGTLIEGELIERQQAARQYGEAKESGHSPAILEWIDNRTYRARIYPIAASGTRRVVLRYIELTPAQGGKLTYVYPMGGRSPMRIGELSLSVDLGDEGREMDIATLAEARVQDGGRRVTMRRSGYTPRVDFQLEAELPKAESAVRVSRFAEGEGADYVMARYTPDVDWDAASRTRADVVVVVDTSAGGDEASRRLKSAVAEALLRALSAEDRFALASLDVTPKVLFPADGLAAADGPPIAAALEALAGHAIGGATDLASMFDVSLSRVHDSEQPAVVYVGDGVITSGELTGEQVIERLRRALGTSRARLYTVAVGAESDHALLGELARAGGGASLRVDDAQEATARALELVAAIKVPTLVDFELDLGAGLDEPFMNVSGKVTRGTEVVLLARTHHDLPKRVAVRGRLGGKAIEQEVPVRADKTVAAAFVPRLWAAEYVRRLLGAASGIDAERGRIAALGIEYGLMTPFTSILALESEAAYRRMGIPRRQSPLRGVRLSSLDRRGEVELRARLYPADVPLAFGCDRSAPSTSAGAHNDEDKVAAPAREEDGEMASPPAEEDNREGGQGVRQRAKGEEKSMGDPGEPASPAPRAAAKLKTPEPLGPGGGGGEKDQRANEGSEDVDLPPPAGRQHAQQPLLTVALGTCSADAGRPLSQRALVWRKRLATAEGAAELLDRYQAALRACELQDWKAERTFLELLQRQIDSEGAARLVLGALAPRPEVQSYVARLLLRRAVDERLIAAVEGVLFGAAVRWDAVDLELSAIEDAGERVAALRGFMARAPQDPNGVIRLVELLAEAGKSDEALRLGRLLREQGLMTLKIARQLGDVLARADLEDEAIRTYSEIVEFDPESTASRRLLGDIYLSRGWFEPAYRQYATTAEAAPGDPLSWLRLATAAAGAGRVDEALRIDRRVATAQGRPGPDDPRRWARLWSAARLGGLLHKPPAGVAPEALERKLKELGLFRGEGTLVILTWNDPTADVVLVARDGEGSEVAVGEPTDAAAAGLSANLLAQADLDRVKMWARLRSLPRREPLSLVRHDLRWDGKKLAVAVRQTKLTAGDTAAEL